VNFTIIAAAFPLIFLGELPDKTMFASLVMASRGRPLSVWAGAAVAFTAHVVIAVSIGVALFHLLPHRVVEGVVAAAFFAGAIYSFAVRNQEEETAQVRGVSTPLRTAATAAGVIFIAEWGDLTQILTANLAARYNSPLSVGLGALVALWAVAALAVVAGASLLKVLSVHTLRLITAGVLVALGIYALISAI
jgi:putative Ca2+/H+ antiporter (TMEM165/GDT1 family)